MLSLTIGLLQLATAGMLLLLSKRILESLRLTREYYEMLLSRLQHLSNHELDE